MGPITVQNNLAKGHIADHRRTCMAVSITSHVLSLLEAVNALIGACAAQANNADKYKQYLCDDIKIKYLCR